MHIYALRSNNLRIYDSLNTINDRAKTPMADMIQHCKKILVILLTTFSMGISAGPEYVPEDPYIEINRASFYFNHMVFSLYVNPATKVYKLFPLPVRESVNNFIQNMRTVPYTINSLLQGKIEQTFRMGLRFLLNSTAGVFGLFDVAAEMGIPEKQESLGDTFYAWGWKESDYVVVPLIGPSTIRDAWGLLGDYFMGPPAYFPPDYWNPYYLTVLVNQNYRAQEVKDLVSIAGVNDYAFIRSGYLQHRYFELTGESMSGDDPEALGGPPD